MVHTDRAVLCEFVVIRTRNSETPWIRHWLKDWRAGNERMRFTLCMTNKKMHASPQTMI